MPTSTGTDLVTGGAGFVGGHRVDHLIVHGRRVRVLDDHVMGRRTNLKPHAGDARLEAIEADVIDVRAVDAACTGVERPLGEIAGS